MNDRKTSAFIGAAVTLAVGAAIILLAVRGGHADHAPIYHPDGLVVYGDWGLYRPGHVFPWSEGPYVDGYPRYSANRYFPTNRNDPGAYRPRSPVDRAPIPPEPYFRSWGAQSQQADPGRATVYAPFAPPSVIYAPSLDFDKDHKDGKPGHKKK